MYTKCFVHQVGSKQRIAMELTKKSFVVLKTANTTSPGSRLFRDPTSVLTNVTSSYIMHIRTTHRKDSSIAYHALSHKLQPEKAPGKLV